MLEAFRNEDIDAEISSTTDNRLVMAAGAGIGIHTGSAREIGACQALSQGRNDSLRGHWSAHAIQTGETCVEQMIAGIDQLQQ